MAEAENYNSQKIAGSVGEQNVIHTQETTFARPLLVILENYTPLRTDFSSLSSCAGVELQLPKCPVAISGTTLPRRHCQEAQRVGTGVDPDDQASDPPLDMAFLARCFGCQAYRSVILLNGRYLQSRVWMRLPDAWPLSLQQARGRARGNEYQPSNIKRKHKHGWVRRLSTPAGVQVILRRMLKGRKSLSH